MINTSITLGYTSTLDPKTHNPIQKTLEPCEDCVSRQTVKERMIKYGFLAPDMTVTEFVEDELPPVTPKPKTGYWKYKKFAEETGISNSNWCSVCNYPMVQAYNNYCGHCGAKMVKLHESKDVERTI